VTRVLTFSRGILGDLPPVKVAGREGGRGISAAGTLRSPLRLGDPPQRYSDSPQRCLPLLELGRPGEVRVAECPSLVREGDAGRWTCRAVEFWTSSSVTHAGKVRKRNAGLVLGAGPTPACGQWADGMGVTKPAIWQAGSWWQSLDADRAGPKRRLISWNNARPRFFAPTGRSMALSRARDGATIGTARPRLSAVRDRHYGLRLGPATAGFIGSTAARSGSCHETTRSRGTGRGRDAVARKSPGTGPTT